MSPADNAHLSSLVEENRRLREALEKVASEFPGCDDLSDYTETERLVLAALREGANQ